MADYEIFREQLSIQYPSCGYALWEPSPTNPNRPVQISDVGFIREGRFYRLFSALLPAGDPSQEFEVPEYHECLVPTLRDHVATVPLGRNNYCSPGVKVEADPGYQQSSQADFPQVLLRNQTTRAAAVLSLPVTSRRENTLIQSVFGRWIVKHIETWFTFARNLGLVHRMEEIILVIGCDLTRSWTNVVFLGGWADAQVSFGVMADGPDNSINFQYLPSHGRGALLHHGPEGTNLPENQCVFIRGFHVAPSIWILPKRLKAASGPSPDPGAYDSDMEAVSMPTVSQFRDPLHLLSDYIAKAGITCLQATDCDKILVHDDDMLMIDGIGPGSLLETLKPDVMVDLLQKSNIKIHRFGCDLFLEKSQSEPNADLSSVKVATLSMTFQDWSPTPPTQKIDLSHTSELRGMPQPSIPGNLSVPTFRRESTNHKSSLLPEHGDGASSTWSKLDKSTESTEGDDLEEREGGEDSVINPQKSKWRTPSKLHHDTERGFDDNSTNRYGCGGRDDETIELDKSVEGAKDDDLEEGEEWEDDDTWQSHPSPPPSASSTQLSHSMTVLPQRNAPSHRRKPPSFHPTKWQRHGNLPYLSSERHHKLFLSPFPSVRRPFLTSGIFRTLPYSIGPIYGPVSQQLAHHGSVRSTGSTGLSASHRHASLNSSDLNRVDLQEQQTSSFDRIPDTPTPSSLGEAVRFPVSVAAAQQKEAQVTGSEAEAKKLEVDVQNREAKIDVDAKMRDLAIRRKEAESLYKEVEAKLHVAEAQARNAEARARNAEAQSWEAKAQVREIEARHREEGAYHREVEAHRFEVRIREEATRKRESIRHHEQKAHHWLLLEKAKHLDVSAPRMEADAKMREDAAHRKKEVEMLHREAQAQTREAEALVRETEAQSKGDEASWREHEACLLEERVRQALEEAERLESAASQAEASTRMYEAPAQQKETEARIKERLIKLEAEVEQLEVAARQAETSAKMDEVVSQQQEAMARNREAEVKDLETELQLREAEVYRREEEARRKEEIVRNLEERARQSLEEAKQLDERIRQVETETKMREVAAQKRELEVLRKEARTVKLEAQVQIGESEILVPETETQCEEEMCHKESEGCRLEDMARRALEKAEQLEAEVQDREAKVRLREEALRKKEEQLEVEAKIRDDVIQKKEAEAVRAEVEAKKCEADARRREAEALAWEAEAQRKTEEARRRADEAHRLEEKARQVEASAKMREIVSRQKEAMASDREAEAKKLEAKVQESEAEVRRKNEDANRKEAEALRLEENARRLLATVTEQEEDLQRRKAAFAEHVEMELLRIGGAASI